MKSLLTILFFCFSFWSMGQITFKKTFGTAGYDKGESIIQLADSSYIIAGSTGEFGGNGGEIYLLKVDSTAQFIWSKDIGGSNVDWSSEVIQTLDSGLAIAGYTNSMGNGGYDMYLVKTDIDGNVLWEKTYGGTDWDFGYALIQMPDSGYVIVGESYSFNSTHSELYLVRTDPSGNLMWERTYSSIGDARANSIAYLSSSEFLVGGYATNASGDRDGWLLKTDTHGNIIFSKKFGYAGGDDQITDLHEFYNGNYVFVGHTATIGPGYGGIDPMIWAVDINGDSLWSRFHGGADDEYCYSVASHPSNGWIYIVGGTKSLGQLDGFQDVYVFELNNFGQYHTGSTFGFDGDDVGKSIVYASDGGWCMAGYTEQGGIGGSDIWVVKYDSLNDTLDAGQASYIDVTSTENITSVTEKTVRVYPNPANDFLYVKGIDSGTKIRLYDYSGKLILEEAYHSELPVKVRGFGSGMYFIQVIDNTGTTLFRKKVVIAGGRK